MTAAKQYSPSVKDSLIKVMLKHQELRSLENRKRLVLYVWRVYSPLFNAACNASPALVDEILEKCPDSDSILRGMRDLQNTDGKFVDAKRATEKVLEELGTKQLEDFSK
jgi:hypothetical protein